jgi:minor histocompatibility antigen H13
MEAKKEEIAAEPVYKTYGDGTILYNMSFVGLFGLWAASYFVALPIQVNTIMTSTLIIFLASHRSLRLLDHDAIPLEEKETLSEKDAYKFPIFGSISLFGLYAAFKYLDKDTVNLVLACYFSVVGVFTLTGTFAPFAKLFIKSDKQYGFKKTFPLVGEIDARLNSAEIVCMILAIVFSWFYFKTKHYMMNNVLGISLCIQAIERMSIGSYKIGAILLVGLFFYDIFWVFGTDVMVTVAKSFDGPIKLLFPKVCNITKFLFNKCCD